MKKVVKIILSVLLATTLLLLIGYILFLNPTFKKYEGKGTEYLFYDSEGHTNFTFFSTDVQTGDGINTYTLVGSYKCSSKESTCEILNVDYYSHLALIKDNNSFYVYDIKNKKRKQLYLKYNDSIRSLIWILNDDNKVAGISIGKEKDADNNLIFKYAFYDYNKGKYTTDFIYDGFKLVSKYIVGIYNASIENQTYHVDLLYLKNGKLYKTINNINDIIYYKDSNVYVASIQNATSKIVDLYNSKFESILPKNTVLKNAVVNSNGTITYNDENYFYIIDNTGNIKKKSKKYASVYKVDKDYAIVKDNKNNLLLVDTKDEIITTYCVLTDNLTVHPLLSGQNTYNDITGIFAVLEDTSIEYGQMGRAIKYYYIPEEKKTDKIVTDFIG